MHQGGVDGDPVEPGRELRLAAEGREPAMDVAERFLQDVLGVAGVAGQPERDPVDSAGVPLHELLERRRVARARAADQLMVRRGHRL
jgi:hypothetical protein